LGRNNAVFLRTGQRLNLKNTEFIHDQHPIDEGCACYSCRTFTRSYLRHLIQAKEMLAATLLSIHNLYTLVQLAKDLRAAIVRSEFEEFVSLLELKRTPDSLEAEPRIE
jgi:queuine tRNA-ribosyltransferase